MAHIRKKMKKGRPYNVRETARAAGKPEVVYRIYPGAAGRIRDLMLGKGFERRKLAARELGAL